MFPTNLYKYLTIRKIQTFLLLLCFLCFHLDILVILWGWLFMELFPFFLCVKMIFFFWKCLGSKNCSIWKVIKIGIFGDLNFKFGFECSNMVVFFAQYFPNIGWSKKIIFLYLLLQFFLIIILIFSNICTMITKLVRMVFICWKLLKWKGTTCQKPSALK